MIPATSGTQYAFYLQYVSGSDGSVGLSNSYDSQLPNTAGVISYYSQYSAWIGSAQDGIALAYTFCGKQAFAKLSNASLRTCPSTPAHEEGPLAIFCICCRYTYP